MEALLDQMRAYADTPIGALVLLGTGLEIVAVIMVLILLIMGKQTNRVGQIIITVAALAAFPIVALAVLPNLFLALIFLVISVFEIWLMVSPARRARDRKRAEALDSLDRLGRIPTDDGPEDQVSQS